MFVSRIRTLTLLDNISLMFLSSPAELSANFELITNLLSLMIIFLLQRLSLMILLQCVFAALAGELCREDKEQWFFFSPGQEREARGGRPNRTTACGYWKATGSPGYVYSSDNKVIGVKKTMVFYKGKAPSGRKTKWKMNEYRAIQVSNQSNTATPQVYIASLYIIIMM